MGLTVDDVYTLLAWVAAGFLASEVRRYVAPARRGTETERIIEAVIFSAVIIWSVRLIARILDPLVAADLVQWSESRSVTLILITLLLGPLAGYIYGSFISSRLCRAVQDRLGLGNESPGDVWSNVVCLRSDEPGRWVYVLGPDGQRYCGKLLHVSSDPDPDSVKEVYLTDAYVMGPDLVKQFDIDAVYLCGDSIKAIEFSPMTSRPGR